MGFKYKRVDLTAGSAEFPTGDTDALRIERSETILKKCVEAIIATDTGWNLDPDRNQQVTNFSYVPCKSGALTFPGLFLTNSTSGCKMFLAYFGGNQSETYCIKDFKEPASGAVPEDLYVYAASNHGGLCASIIPADSQSVFGNSFDSSFLPNDATRIIGTTLYWGTYYGFTSFGGNPTSGYIYSWGFFVTPYTIAVSCAIGNGTKGDIGIPTYTIGRIIGVLGHEEDNAVNAKYGVILFRNCTSTSEQCEGLNPLMGNKYYLFNSSVQTPFIMGRRIGSIPLYEDTCACICNSSGTWIRTQSMNDVDVNCCFYTQDVFSTSSFMFSKTGNTRWSPFALCAPSTNLQTAGVVPGDGFKGLVDTDLFRASSVSSYGEMFDNGNFVSLDADTAFLIGWDSTNTDSLAG